MNDIEIGTAIGMIAVSVFGIMGFFFTMVAIVTLT